ncbi:MAG: MBOAT family protein [Nitrospirota bacterium]
MLFNSFEFIFLFLPITVIGFSCIGKYGHKKLAVLWLVTASLFYYSWWNPVYFWLITASIVFNYGIGTTLSKQLSLSKFSRKIILASGIALNLSLLGYFKYANFFLKNINSLLDQPIVHWDTIFLPLAISFFTFQQIAYLADAYEDRVHEHSFLHYCLFVTFFPQLISGPIVHHKEMMPQFERNSTYKLSSENIAVGLTIFFIGLFKKAVLADGIAVYAAPVFEAAEQNILLTFLEAWGGALGYTFQIYFDFSGYSDMAIGLGRMFGINLPLNFHSPYKAKSIIEFWRRWHITLSRFLRDYLYIPLGGNRKGSVRRYLNLMIVMFLGGLWHGAGWTFIAWGAMHGFYLIINNSWRTLLRALGYDSNGSGWLGQRLSQIVTFTAVVLAWVIFRAESINGAENVLKGMAGLNGFVMPESYLDGLNQIAPIKSFLANIGWEFHSLKFLQGKAEILSLFFLLIVSWCAPNTQQIMHRYQSVFDIYRVEVKKWRWNFLRWTPNFAWFLFTLTLATISIYRMMSYGYKEFIYRFF